MANSHLTTFYVKNNTDKTVNFKASVEKLNTMGAYNMTLTFKVKPLDRILARRTNFKNGISPSLWFTDFVIFPNDGVKFNDPRDSRNWIKSTDIKGKFVYTFNIAK